VEDGAGGAAVSRTGRKVRAWPAIEAVCVQSKEPTPSQVSGEKTLDGAAGAGAWENLGALQASPLRQGVYKVKNPVIFWLNISRIEPFITL